jgi:P-type Ca2+ transporter type 2C
MDTKTPWHTLSTDEALTRLQSSLDGLTNEEAARRLAEYGPNELTVAPRSSPWKLLLDPLKNGLIVILLIAAVLSAFLGFIVEAIAIAVIALFNVLLGFIQKYYKGLRI